LHVGEPFGAEQVLGDDLGRQADAGQVRQADARRLGRRLGKSSFHRKPRKPDRSPKGETSKERPTVPSIGPIPHATLFAEG